MTLKNGGRADVSKLDTRNTFTRMGRMRFAIDFEGYGCLDFSNQRSAVSLWRIKTISEIIAGNVYVDRQFQRRIFEVAAEYSVTRPVKASVSFYDRVPSKPIDRTRFYTPFDMTAMVSHRLDDLSNSPSPGPI